MMRPTPIIVASGNGAKALPAGVRILKRGGTALDAVEACARFVEADVSDTSVGKGGLPNLGQVELDASIVDGTTHRVGSVAALQGFLPPATRTPGCATGGSEQRGRLRERWRSSPTSKRSEETAPDLLAFTHFPRDHWRQMDVKRNG